MKLNQTRSVFRSFTIRVPAAGLPIGVLPLEVFAPNNCVGIAAFHVRILTAFASGGVPTLDIGTATDPNGIVAAAALAALAPAGAADGAQVLAAQVILTTGEELQATVNVAAYTAGEYQCRIEFVTFAI